MRGDFPGGPSFQPRGTTRPDEELFVEASHLDDVEPEPALDVGVVPAPEAEDYDAIPGGPLPELLTFTLPANNVPTLITEPKPYRRLLVLTSPHEAAQIEVSYFSTFPESDYALLAIATLKVPIYPGQRLFMRQPAVLPLRVSVILKPDLLSSPLGETKESV